MILNYDWSTNPLVIDFLRKIYGNTLKSMIENGYDTQYATEIINDIEDYLYYFKIHNYNLNNIIYKLQDIESIEFYDSLVLGKKNNDGLEFPPVINQYTRILINSDIKGDKRLTSRERRRLYLYQGLSHSLISMQTTKTIEFSKIFSNYLKTSKSNVEMIINKGWLLIEDTLSQEIAEKVTYYSLDKIRPKYRIGLEDEIFPISGSKVSSNLEMYRVFQPLIVSFGLTLSKVASYDDYNEKTIIEDLTKYAVQGCLSNLVIAEYNVKRNHIELYRLLYLMGLMVNEMNRKYKMHFIHDLTLEEKDYDEIFENILEITNRLISFEKEDYKDTDISGVKYDEETRQNVLKLVRYHEI